MNVLLRKYAEWKGRRKAAQIIVFDGASEIERTRAFLKGAGVGAAVALGLFAVAGPAGVDARLLEEMRRREALVQEASLRADQAAGLVHACLRTAEGLEETVHAYRRLLSPVDTRNAAALR